MVSRPKYMCAYIGPAYVSQLYTYACKEHAYTYMPQNPSPKTKTQKIERN